MDTTLDNIISGASLDSIRSTKAAHEAVYMDTTAQSLGSDIRDKGTCAKGGLRKPRVCNI